MRTGYRNGYKYSETVFTIKSDTEQVNFNLSDEYLKVNVEWNKQLAPIERVNIYLADKRVLENIFVVNSSLMYYYEKKWYYSGDPRAGVPPTPKNICEKFNFKTTDILLIVANNTPKKVSYDFGLLFSLFEINPLDTNKSIEKNDIDAKNSW